MTGGEAVHRQYPRRATCDGARRGGFRAPEGINPGVSKIDRPRCHGGPTVPRPGLGPGAGGEIRGAQRRDPGEEGNAGTAVPLDRPRPGKLPSGIRTHRETRTGDALLRAGLSGHQSGSGATHRGDSAARLKEAKQDLPDARAEIERLEKSMATLRRMPRAVTPVIFSFGEGTALRELLAPEVRVSFDLDG